MHPFEKRKRFEMRTLIVLFVFILFSFISVESKDVSKSIKDFESLTKEQKICLIKDVIRQGSFIETSSDFKFRPQTIGKFFNKKIYKKLLGNDILGYIYDEGLKTGSKNVYLKVIKYFNETEKYKNEFSIALKMVFKRYGIRFNKDGEVEIGIALLDVDPKISGKSLPGGMIEYYLKERKSGKYLFHRLGTGNKKGLKYAFMELAIIIVNFLGV